VTYEVEITPEGFRHLTRPPDTVRAAVLETIFGSIAESPQARASRSGVSSKGSTRRAGVGSA